MPEGKLNPNAYTSVQMPQRKRICKRVNIPLLRNDPIWFNLGSDVLKIDALIEEVSQKSVTGFIEFIFPEFSATILLDDGEILQCVKIKDEKTYPVNKSEILEYLKKMKATVGLYRLKKETVLATYRIMNSEPMFENMSTQYVDVKKLLLTLETDKFSGIITVRAERRECSVVLEKGIPVCCLSNKMNGSVDYVACLKEFLEILKEKNMVVSAYKENENTSVGARLRKIAREVLGEDVEKIEKMLKESGKSREKLLKAAEEIKKFTYLFLDKKKADMLSQRLKETIEEGFSEEWDSTTSNGKEKSPTEMDDGMSEDETLWFLRIACSSYYKQ